MAKRSETNDFVDGIVQIHRLVRNGPDIDSKEWWLRVVQKEKNRTVGMRRVFVLVSTSEDPCQVEGNGRIRLHCEPCLGP